MILAGFTAHIAAMLSFFASIVDFFAWIWWNFGNKRYLCNDALGFNGNCNQDSVFSRF